MLSRYKYKYLIAKYKPLVIQNTILKLFTVRLALLVFRSNPAKSFSSKVVIRHPTNFNYMVTLPEPIDQATVVPILTRARSLPTSYSCTMSRPSHRAHTVLDISPLLDQSLHIGISNSEIKPVDYNELAHPPGYSTTSYIQALQQQASGSWPGGAPLQRGRG